MSSGEDFLAFTKEGKGDKSQDAPALITSFPSPWLRFEIVDREAPPMVRFHNEMLTFSEYIAPTALELTRRTNVLTDIKRVVSQLWPQATVHVFGSQLTKILTPTSDIDIAILGVPEEKKTLLNNLSDLAEALGKEKLASYLEVISSAKVPIVKLDHIRYGISVDICVNNDSGLITGKLVRQFVREYPPLRPLTIILKIFLAQRKLNETYSGGVGSFVLCCTIVSFLQMRRRLETHRRISLSWNLGALLVDYLYLYSTSFNYMHSAISVAAGGAYFRRRSRGGEWHNPARPGLLGVENPDTPSIDMGRNSFMYAKVRRAFEHAHQLLTCALADSRIDSYLAFVIRPDDPAMADRPAPQLQLQKDNAQICADDDDDDVDGKGVGGDDDDEDEDGDDYGDGGEEDDEGSGDGGELSSRLNSTDTSSSSATGGGSVRARKRGANAISGVDGVGGADGANKGGKKKHSRREERERRRRGRGGRREGGGRGGGGGGGEERGGHATSKKRKHDGGP